MVDKRFPWSRRTNMECLYELKSRDIHHPLDKDSGLKCIAEGCRRTCKKDEDCYLPTYNPGPDNKIVAHFDCVMERTSAHTAAGAREAKVLDQRRLEQRGILHPAKPSVGRDLQAYVERISEAAYQRGLEEGERKGRQSILAELEAVVDMTT